MKFLILVLFISILCEGQKYTSTNGYQGKIQKPPLINDYDDYEYYDISNTNRMTEVSTQTSITTTSITTTSKEVDYECDDGCSEETITQKPKIKTNILKAESDQSSDSESESSEDEDENNYGIDQQTCSFQCLEGYLRNTIFNKDFTSKQHQKQTDSINETTNNLISLFEMSSKVTTRLTPFRNRLTAIFMDFIYTNDISNSCLASLVKVIKGVQDHQFWAMKCKFVINSLVNKQMILFY